jgi:hypothetical protein
MWENAMKKYIKPILILLFVIVLLWIFGLQVPFIASKARDRIEKGMTISKVVEIVTSYSKKPDICTWEKEGVDRAILSSRKQCNFPVQDVPLSSDGKSIKLTVVFMGPAFLHNDFKIYFDSSGSVLSISEVKHLD